MWPSCSIWTALTRQTPARSHRRCARLVGASSRSTCVRPGSLRGAGDMVHLAALCSPRRVVRAGGVWGSGKALTADERTTCFRFAATTWKLQAASQELRLLGSDDAMRIVAALKERGF